MLLSISNITFVSALNILCCFSVKCWIESGMKTERLWHTGLYYDWVVDNKLDNWLMGVLIQWVGAELRFFTFLAITDIGWCQRFDFSRF